MPAPAETSTCSSFLQDNYSLRLLTYPYRLWGLTEPSPLLYLTHSLRVLVLWMAGLPLDFRFPDCETVFLSFLRFLAVPSQVSRTHTSKVG